MLCVDLSASAVVNMATGQITPNFSTSNIVYNYILHHYPVSSSLTAPVFFPKTGSSMLLV